MDFFEVVDERRSIRSFKEGSLCDETVEKIISAGMKAPSAGNMQPWEFIIVKDSEIKKRITKETYLGYMKKEGKPQNWMMQAQVFIVCCVNYVQTMSRYGEFGKHVALLDVAASIENMLLATTALGLASCWVSGFRTEGIKEILNLPDNIEPVAVLPIGIPEKKPASPPKFDLEYIVHYEKYNG
jgi:nitroreductase